jgi:hypothetical protein
MRFFILFVLLAMAGCSFDQNLPKDPLVGTWAVAPMLSSAPTITFEGSDTVTQMGTWKSGSSAGKYYFDGSTVTLGGKVYLFIKEDSDHLNLTYGLTVYELSR